MHHFPGRSRIDLRCAPRLVHRQMKAGTEGVPAAALGPGASQTLGDCATDGAHSSSECFAVCGRHRPGTSGDHSGVENEVTVGVLNIALIAASSSATCRALVGRLSGSFSSMRSIRAESGSGTSLLRSMAGMCRLKEMLRMVSIPLGAANGWEPVTIW